MFERVGRVVLPKSAGSFDTVFEAAAEAGAEDVEEHPGDEDTEGSYEVICEADAFSDVRDALTARFGDPREARLGWRPMSTQPVSGDQAQTLMKLIDILEDNDDVQQVASNVEISEDDVQKLSA
jgi:transcriptional/translational regulatory protein YebC/TACO1